VFPFAVMRVLNRRRDLRSSGPCRAFGDRATEQAIPFVPAQAAISVPDNEQEPTPMSYAGPAGRTKRASTIEPLRVESGSRSGVGRRGGYAPRGASSSRSTTYFAAGIAVGIAVGAGVALLF